MVKKQYTIAIIDEAGDSYFTFQVNPKHWIVGGILGVCILGLLGFSLWNIISFRLSKETRLAEKRKMEFLDQRLQKWEERIQQLESLLREVQRRNQQLRATAFLSLPELEYGTGGSHSESSSNLFEFLELQSLAKNLDSLEFQIKKLEYSTQELEKAVSQRTQEIAHYPSVSPVRGGWISSSFGNRVDPFTGKIEFHPGIDISIKPGTEVYATAAGIVKEANTKIIPNKGYGMYIVIDHGFGYETLYGHLSKIFVKKGQKVNRWDLIGLTGNTGKSTAPHLHYSVSIRGEMKNPLYFNLE